MLLDHNGKNNPAKDVHQNFRFTTVENTEMNMASIRLDYAIEYKTELSMVSIEHIPIG